MIGRHCSAGRWVLHATGLIGATLLGVSTATAWHWQQAAPAWLRGWLVRFLRSARILAVTAAALLSVACASPNRGEPLAYTDQTPREHQLIRCALPGQIRELGPDFTYLSASRVIKTSPSDCQARGGSVQPS